MNSALPNNLPSVATLKTRMNEILENVSIVCKSCGRNPQDIKIIAVTKTHPPELIINALEAGITIFGENYAQELKDKSAQVSLTGFSPEWHFIGHLQTNKVKYLAPFVKTIHSVDSVHLAEEISRQAAKNDRTIDILLQVNTSAEDSKFGCEPKEIFSLSENILKIPYINIRGLMTIGSFSENDLIVRTEFRMLFSLREKLIQEFGPENFRELSMGMTSDYDKAIEEGATMVRIGTAIFGYRKYH